MTKIAYSAPEVAKLLGISKSAAYNLMHREDFPSFRIGRRWLIQESCLNAWIEKQPDISKFAHHKYD
ncbi:helix-turn-helix domain-containing protein [Agathobaculum desmolans]|uniref:helix-turn-helix domain-containing protein n=1 Tax=Agathobaculum desmolans TaxID=39484 RepID=UPI0009905446|nr:helix-turn-helix domain-containing protein [Agathobaculum desmolans]